MTVMAKSFLSAFALVVVFSGYVAAEEPRDFNAYPDHVRDYLQHIYTEGQGQFAYRPDYPGGFDGWRKAARASLSERIGLDKIAAQNTSFEPRVALGVPEDRGDYIRQKCGLVTEASVTVPFWLLKPKGEGPFPLAVLPHGHDTAGLDTHAGIAHDDNHQARIDAGDRDVAVQAVKRGFLAIAPATRGLATDGVPDILKRHGDRDCRSHVMHCLLAGRTAIGERVWDVMRLIDWATARPDVDSSRILVMGNSGGGMVTLYTAACDTRVTVAVPSCSFTQATSPAGYIYHCDCNMVPGLLEWGNLSDVAGLAAPRWMVAINGREDALHAEEDIERAAKRAGEIFAAAGVPERFEHRWGNEGHRFYSDLMWPFIEEALKGKK